MKILKTLPVIIFILFAYGCQRPVYEFNADIKNYEETNRGIQRYYFYPGTIKMLNFKKDTAFYNLFHDVKRIKVLSFSSNEKDSLNPHKVKALIEKIHRNGYEDMFSMNQDKTQTILMIKKEKGIPHQIGINMNDKDLYMVEIIGNLKMSFLMSFLRKENNFDGFNTVLNLNKGQKTEQSQKSNEKHPRN